MFLITKRVLGLSSCAALAEQMAILTLRHVLLSGQPIGTAAPRLFFCTSLASNLPLPDHYKNAISVSPYC